MTSQRVKTTLSRHGLDFYSRIGKIGFQVTCDRHFNGDREAMKRWLTDTGQWANDCHTSYHKPEIFGWPGFHPAEVARLSNWLDYVERATSPNFPTFFPERSNDEGGGE